MKSLNIVSGILLCLALTHAAFAEEPPRGPSLWKTVKYEASLESTQWWANERWTKIEPYPIYLGGLPLINKGDSQKIPALGVTRVLSMVENFEIEDGWLGNKPVKPADWEAQQIQVKRIQAVDYYPVTNDEIREGVQYLTEMVADGQTIYVHCKAGRGRSATIVVAYLMQQEGLSLDDAIAHVKKQRPQINLNAGQRKAIADYFNIEDGAKKEEESYLTKAQEVTQEAFAKVLTDTLSYVIDGYETSKKLPETISAWAPDMDVQSTLQRRNRYLRESQGDQELAVKTAIQRNQSLKRTTKKTIKTTVASALPVAGTAAAYGITLWYELREIALIAALYGHDVKDPQVQTEILASLIDGSAHKIPAQTVDVMAKLIVKKMLLQAGVSNIPGAAIPSHLIFNYFTNNSAKVSTHAIKRFGGEHVRPMPEESYAL